MGHSRFRRASMEAMSLPKSMTLADDLTGMGMAYAPLKVRNRINPECEVEITAMTDTGAAMLCIPESIADALNLVKNGQAREVTVAVGRKHRRRMSAPLMSG